LPPSLRIFQPPRRIRQSVTKPWESCNYQVKMSGVISQAIMSVPGV
jgi:hypothetical protein